MTKDGITALESWTDNTAQTTTALMSDLIPFFWPKETEWWPKRLVRAFRLPC